MNGLVDLAVTDSTSSDRNRVITDLSQVMSLLAEDLDELRLVEPLAEVGVEAIFDCIICAAWYLLGNITPAVPVN